MIPPARYDRQVADLTPHRPPTLLEAALQSPRVATAVLLVAVPGVCWVWIIAMARDMYGPMTGASRWMMTSSWDAVHVFLLWTMWAVMMIGMMLPGAAPAILLYGAAARRRQGQNAAARTYALTAGYVSTWAVFSLLATALQRALGMQLLLSPMMETTSPRTGGALLIAAGVYQLTPLKQACLSACQSPLGFLMSRWRDGARGAFRMGLEHGLYCLGCCWALMLLLFAGGVMNLVVIGALTMFVVCEKAGLFGRHGTRVSGALLVASGCWFLTR
jgi:predicted metal-binding membrane protein